MKNNWLTIRNEADAVEMMISGPIGDDFWSGGGNSAKAFRHELNAIPRSKRINIKVNSEGGVIQDGLEMHDAIRSRRDDITVHIVGYACSTASWLGAAAGKVVTSRNALWMIHKSSAGTYGNADDHQKSVEALKKHDESIAGMIAQKTGQKIDVVLADMEKETWFTGEEAKAYGLADEVMDDNATLPDNAREHVQNTLRTLMGAKAPVTNSGTDAREKEKTAANPPSNKTTMKREQIVALLTARGQKVADDATDEQLLTMLNTLLDKKPEPEKKKEEPAGNGNSDIIDLKNAIKSLTDERDRERKNRIERAVDGFISEDRLVGALRDKAIARALADESYLDELAAMPQNPVGAPGAGLIVGNEDVRDTLKGFEKFNEPMKAFQRGASVRMESLRDASVNKAGFYNKNRAKVLVVMNTNTVATELKRQVILQESIVDFRRRLLALSAFSTVHQNVPLEGTNKVEVPFYDLDSSASTSFVSGTGYTTIGNTTTDKREITVGEGAADGDRLYQALSFTSSEIARQPFLKIMQLAQLKAEKLASDIVADILGIVTAANYGAASKAEPAAAFDSDDIADLKLACKLWPDVGRSLFLDSAYDANCLKDPAFKHALNAASDSAIKEGRLYPRVMGFDYVEIPTIPANAENLVGFAVFKSAILVATAPVPPVEEVRNAGTTYEIVTDPQTGISFEYRSFGNNVTDAATHTIECSYGFAKGNGNALKRITSA